MFPELFSIGGFTLTSYGFMAALGALAAIFIFDRNLHHAALSEKQATTITILVIISGLAGARIYYVIQYYDEIFHFMSFWSIFKIWEGGLVFYGGPLLVLPVIYFYCRREKLVFRSVLDICAPALTVAHALGRIGCLLNGCCFSTVACSMPWAVTYPAFSEAARKTAGAAVHPVQLYESCFDLLITIPLFSLARYGRPGAAAGVYMLLYGIWRFFIEFWRNELKYGPFSSAQYISMGFIATGIILIAMAVLCGRKKANHSMTAAADEKC